MFELEPQAWTIHLLVLGFINLGAVAVVLHRQKEQWKELSRFREQCRRIEEHLMSVRRTMAAQKRESEAPASETNEVVAA
jgi:hypothetical protein